MSDAPVKKQEPNPEVLKALDDMGLSGVYTNPMQSMIVRWALGLLIYTIAENFFDLRLGDESIQRWVDLCIGVLVAVSIIWHRWRSQHTIVTPQQAAELLVEQLKNVESDDLKNDVMQALQKKNPKLKARVEGLLKAVEVSKPKEEAT